MIATAEAVRLVAARLAAAGIEAPRREARLLLAAALRTDAAGLLAADRIEERVFEPLVARRERREPLAYILGHREFWSLDFAVSQATLIPRPDSETLIEAALAAFPDRGMVASILDLGTGTGCLLLAALHEFTGAFGVGVDISPAAVALARRNAKTLGLAARTGFVAADWGGALAAKFDLVLNNPPYITTADLAGLMPEVGGYEPNSALDGGADGFSAYRSVIAALPDLLKPEGAAILELGAGQAAQVEVLAEMAGLKAARRLDVAGMPRAAILTF